LYQAFCNTQTGANVRAQLAFNDNVIGPRLHSNLDPEPSPTSSLKMAIDNAFLVAPVVDFCKRKMGDTNVGTGKWTKFELPRTH